MTLIYGRSRMLLTMNALQKIKRECTVVYVTLKKMVIMIVRLPDH